MTSPRIPTIISIVINTSSRLVLAVSPLSLSPLSLVHRQHQKWPFLYWRRHHRKWSQSIHSMMKRNHPEDNWNWRRIIFNLCLSPTVSHQQKKNYWENDDLSGYRRCWSGLCSVLGRLRLSWFPSWESTREKRHSFVTEELWRKRVMSTKKST